eukprot:COSAG06_NODE_897_length_11651_cov_7.190439_16_plen_330_part_00
MAGPPFASWCFRGVSAGTAWGPGVLGAAVSAGSAGTHGSRLDLVSAPCCSQGQGQILDPRRPAAPLRTLDTGCLLVRGWGGGFSSRNKQQPTDTRGPTRGGLSSPDGPFVGPKLWRALHTRPAVPRAPRRLPFLPDPFSPRKQGASRPVPALRQQRTRRCVAPWPSGRAPAGKGQVSKAGALAPVKRPGTAKQGQYAIDSWASRRFPRRSGGRCDGRRTPAVASAGIPQATRAASAARRSCRIALGAQPKISGARPARFETAAAAQAQRQNLTPKKAHQRHSYAVRDTAPAAQLRPAASRHPSAAAHLLSFRRKSLAPENGKVARSLGS